MVGFPSRELKGFLETHAPNKLITSVATVYGVGMVFSPYEIQSSKFQDTLTGGEVHPGKLALSK